MKKTFLIFIFVLCALSTLAQDIVVKSRVVDASTGDAMPYVSVYVNEHSGAITNHDGDFSISVAPDDILRISYVGYEKRFVKASDLGSTVKLVPMESTMLEVNVRSWTNMLNEVSNKLSREYWRRRKVENQYFCRLHTSFRTHELTEAFVEAKSASNLRDISILKGFHGRLVGDRITAPMIAEMNFHHPFELGPMTQEVYFWQALITPLGSRSSVTFLNKHYNISGVLLTDSTGQQIYRFDLKKKPKANPIAILTGSLYVDAKSLQVLRFEGKVEDTWLDIKKDMRVVSSPIDLNVHINYRHDKGFTQVSDISTLIQCGDFRSQSVLYSVDDVKIEVDSKRKKKKKTAADNLLSSINEAGYDDELWRSSNIMQRTAEEERALTMTNTHKVNIAEELAKAQLQDDERKTNRGTFGDKADPRLEKLTERLELFGKNIPQEKVYLHMDNTCYFLGDTIWFAAYSRRTNDGKPSNISGVLYVELYNQDGYMMERKLIEMRNGRGHGNFALKKDFYGGFYELRAYTRWQLNWGQYEHFNATVSKEWFLSNELHDNYYRDYDKIYSRVFPVYDAPRKDGEYNENMTMRPMRRYFKNDPDKPTLTLSLYPEGGNLVNGLKSRVAYEVLWDDGEEAKLQGKPARGVIEVTPEKGRRQEVTFIDVDGKKVSEKMPKAQDEGVVVTVSQNDTAWMFDIALTPGLRNAVDKAAADSTSAESNILGVSIMHEGNPEKVFALDSLRSVITVAKNELKEGVNQVTVFDVNGRVWADRLFFNAPAKDDNPQLVASVDRVDFSLLTADSATWSPFSSAEEMFAPYQPINLGVHSAPNATLSVAVRDAAHSDQLYDNATLRTEMLLSSEIKGFVPNPRYYFEKDDDEHRAALDLLMMIQGWRRFDWRDMAVKGEWELTQQAERSPVVSGIIVANPDRYKPNYTDEEFASLAITAGYYFANPYTEVSKLAEAWAAKNAAEGGAANVGAATEDRTTTTAMIAEQEKPNPGVPSSNLEERELFLRSKTGRDNKDVLVHAELVSLDGKECRVTEIPTRKGGKFAFLLPGYYGQAILFVSASDSAKWKKKDLQQNRYVWIQQKADEGDLPARHRSRYVVQDPEYAVRLTQPFVRFVKPYHFYQQQLLVTADSALAATKMQDGTTRMREVSIGARRSGMRSFSDSIPAFIIDAQDARNYCLDAGMYSDFPEDIARAYVGDYGFEFPYTSVSIPYSNQSFHHSNIEVRFGYDQDRRATNGLTMNADSVYMRQNLATFKPFSKEDGLVSFLSPKALREFYDEHRIDKYVIYTDFQPRLAGSMRYYGSNLPNTQIAVYPYADDSRRVVYRDRRYVFDGYAYADDFYHPNYKNRKAEEAPKDYRRTLYWNPSLTLDKTGKAEIQFYNNGKSGQISISAEGMTDGGELLGD